MLATAKRLQEKYEKQEERRKNGRKAAIQSHNAVDCSVGALRRDLRHVNEKRVEKARNKERILADKKARICKKAIAQNRVSAVVVTHGGWTRRTVCSCDFYPRG